MNTAEFAVDLMLDSGAFSAWSRKESIDLKDYIKFCKRNQHLCNSIVALDCIPGNMDVARTPEAVEHSARLSYENLQRMHDAGLKPIPVFHQGEDFKWLQKLIDDGEDYIGLGTLKDLSTPAQLAWLDQVFTALTDKDGYPLVKTHGFGTTHTNYMLRYPFYSCDSTTWVMSPGYGKIFVPPRINGKWDYNRTPQAVHLSIEFSKQQLKTTFNALTPLVQQMVTDWLATEGEGISLLKVRNSPKWRRVAAIRYFERFCEHRNHLRFLHRKRSFGNVLSIKAKPLRNIRPHIIYATHITPGFNWCLLEGKGRRRLLSFYTLRGSMEKFLDPYVRTGSHLAADEPPRPIPRDYNNSEYRAMRALALEARLARSVEDGGV